MNVAVDVGTLTVKVTVGGDVTIVPAPVGGPHAGIRAALAVAGNPRGEALCVAVPEAWLTEDGAGLLEDLRQQCEDADGTGQVTWTGQLAAVAGLTAKQRGRGRYLVCDLGGIGVRAGMFDVSDGTVEIVATQAEDGGGWRDFDAAVRSGAPGLPHGWHEEAVGQERRASVVFEDAVASLEEFADTRVYRISGLEDHIDLSAKHLIDSFAPTLRRLRTVIGTVTAAGPPEGVVLVGGLSWFPLAVRAIADAAQAKPVVADPDAAARGALLFADGEVRLALPSDCQAVTVPTHRIRNGLLEEVSVTLPWTASFATLPPGAVMIDRDELELTVAGKSRSVRLRGIVPGPHRVGVRPTWPGPGVLVVRPVSGDKAHVVPLAGLTAR